MFQPLAQPFKLIAPEDVKHPGQKIGNEIINLSNRNLSKHEITLLEKGLKFVPAPTKMTISPFLKAASDFGRRIKLIKHFHYQRNKRTELFTKKSDWVPPTTESSKEIAECVSEMENEIGNLEIPKSTPNISKDEKNAIRSLKSDKTIVIKKADKGSSSVIMNKIDYIFECERQLGQPEHYEKITEPIQPKTAEDIENILKEMKEECLISEKQFEYLKPPENPRPRRFYTLPKIHKPQESWTVPNKIPPGRPIISNCNSETEKVAEYIEAYLKQKSTQHASYIKKYN